MISQPCARCQTRSYPHVTKWKKRIIASKKHSIPNREREGRVPKFTKVASHRTPQKFRKNRQVLTEKKPRWAQLPRRKMGNRKILQKVQHQPKQGKHKSPQIQQMLLSDPSTHSLQPTGSCSTTSSSLSCPPPHPLVFPRFFLIDFKQ